MTAWLYNKHFIFENFHVYSQLYRNEKQYIIVLFDLFL